MFQGLRESRAAFGVVAAIAVVTLAGCAGSQSASPTPAAAASTSAGAPSLAVPPPLGTSSVVPPRPSFAVPPSPNFTPPPAPARSALSAGRRTQSDTGCAAPFFNGAVALSNGVKYLAFSGGGYFGYYADANYPTIYSFDLGFEYVFDVNDGSDGVDLYDYTSQHFWYTSPSLYPYLYDFSLSSFIYYFQGTTNPRQFYDFNTGQYITLGKEVRQSAAHPSPATGGATISGFSPANGVVGTTVQITGTNFTPPISVTFGGNVQASGSFTASMITVTVPSGAQTGSIVVATANGSASTGTFTVGTCSP